MGIEPESVKLYIYTYIWDRLRSRNHLSTMKLLSCMGDHKRITWNQLVFATTHAVDMAIRQGRGASKKQDCSRKQHLSFFLKVLGRRGRTPPPGLPSPRILRAIYGSMHLTPVSGPSIMKQQNCKCILIANKFYLCEMALAECLSQRHKNLKLSG